MGTDALSMQFRALHESWREAIANQEHDWFDRHFAPDFLGTAQPFPTLVVNRQQMIDLDFNVETMDVHFVELTARRYGDVVLTISVVRYDNEQFRDGSTIGDGMPTTEELTGLTRGKEVLHTHAWRHNGEHWQLFDHHMVNVVDYPNEII